MPILGRMDKPQMKIPCWRNIFSILCSFNIFFYHLSYLSCFLKYFSLRNQILDFFLQQPGAVKYQAIFGCLLNCQAAQTIISACLSWQSFSFGYWLSSVNTFIVTYSIQVLKEYQSNALIQEITMLVAVPHLTTQK